jgi:formylmethanofuran dehydrogenase subunit E
MFCAYCGNSISEDDLVITDGKYLHKHCANELENEYNSMFTMGDITD